MRGVQVLIQQSKKKLLENEMQTWSENNATLSKVLVRLAVLLALCDLLPSRTHQEANHLPSPEVYYIQGNKKASMNGTETVTLKADLLVYHCPSTPATQPSCRFEAHSTTIKGTCHYLMTGYALLLKDVTMKLRQLLTRDYPKQKYTSNYIRFNSLVHITRF